MRDYKSIGNGFKWRRFNAAMDELAMIVSYITGMVIGLAWLSSYVPSIETLFVK